MILEPLKIDQDEMLSYLGASTASLDPNWLSSAAKAQELCSETLHAHGIFKVLDKDAVSLPGVDIAEHLDGAQHIVLMAVTLGLSSEQFLRSERSKDLSFGLLVDAAASALVEAAADELEKRIRCQVEADGMHLGGRFSPGYGDLDLSVQSDILDCLDATKQLGIHLNGSFLMVPSKSITAILGIFEQPHRSRSDGSPCKGCEGSDDCVLRAKGRTCHG